MSISSMRQVLYVHCTLQNEYCVVESALKTKWKNCGGVPDLRVHSKPNESCVGVPDLRVHSKPNGSCVGVLDLRSTFNSKPNECCGGVQDLRVHSEII